MPTFAPETKDNGCPFWVYISRRYNGMREERFVSPKNHCLQRNHAPQTAKQKKFLGPLNLSRKDTDLIMNLGQSFMTPRNVVNFKRR